MASKAQSAPHFRRTAKGSQLVVDGKPYLILGGELHNSTWSNAGYMKNIWSQMKAINVNTVLGAVTWDMFEPTEGTVDTKQLDEIIQDARKESLRLIILWFGSYKNATSTYAPGWVRRDPTRFPRIRIRDRAGSIKTTSTLQPYNKDLMAAETSAFRKFMKHLKDIDGEHHTVIMIQVENEVGIMGDSRDRSSEAEALFKSPVPNGLLEYLHANRETLNPSFHTRFDIKATAGKDLTWTEAFGDSVWSDDIFMANAFSTFVQTIAAAGREEYNLPTYTNVALCNEEPSWADDIPIPAFIPAGDTPGQYPSGGPVGHNIDVYRFNAPAIELYGPDIYLQDYDKVCECFTHDGLPLFVPEQRRDEYGLRRIWLAIGSRQAIGCAPFGVDSLDVNETDIGLHYGILKTMAPYILDAQANRPEDIMGFFFDEPGAPTSPSKYTKTFPDFKITVERAFVFGKQGPGAGIVIRQADGSFLGAGFGFQVVFESTDDNSTYSGVLRVEEKESDGKGGLRTVRILNGDETNHENFWIMPSRKPDIGTFPVPVFIPARTFMSRCIPYSI